MSTFSKVGLVVLVLVALSGLWTWSFYNGVVTLDQQLVSQGGNIATQYQRRFELIPNLVESVKGVLKQEQEIFGKLADARSRYVGATNLEDRTKAVNELNGALGRLLVIVENYPQLKSSENMLALQDELAGTENRIAVERKKFNDLVASLNTKIKRFPGNLIAGWFDFSARTPFEAVVGAEKAPGVKF
ncbi:MAG: LemA family protein [Candidatus Yonathbacteria bacterium]|nr:LemA family protein [Candidatus Yonathbacteria bacterium]